MCDQRLIFDDYLQRYQIRWRVDMQCYSLLCWFTVALAVSRDADRQVVAEMSRIQRVMFSSCTQRHMGENSIWTKVCTYGPMCAAKLQWTACKRTCFVEQ